MKPNPKWKTRKDQPRDKLLKRKANELRKLLKELRKESKNDTNRHADTLHK